jgi:hypothetical protein
VSGDAWLALGAGALLAVAAAASGMRLARRLPEGEGEPPAAVGRRAWLVVGARIGALALLAAAVGLAAGRGPWTPPDARPAALGLSLATVLCHLALTVPATARREDAGPVADLVALGLALAAVAAAPRAPTLACAQCTAALAAYGALALLGGGASLVAGSAALMLALAALSAGSRRQAAAVGRASAALCERAAGLALVVLGAALTAGAYWAWQALGTPGSGDLRGGWLAVTWLLEAMSLLAWRLNRGATRLAAGLAVLAAAAALWANLLIPLLA